jgi:predicted alpha/beta hydrolase
MMPADIRRLETGSGFDISASFFRPDGEPLGTVLIVPAMGTPQSYYARLAEWLTSHGYLVATFDYAGTGRSRYADIRQITLDLIDWGRFDCTRMVDELATQLPGKPLYWLGHSMGGQLLAFTLNREKITRMITVATGSGYWRENSAPLRRRAWWLWYVMAPLTLRVYGYYPGRRLRKVGDLPRTVMAQWRRWCLHPEYAVGAEGDSVRAQFAAVTTPITSISFTDDEMMSARNTESIHGFYRNAPRVMRRLTPGEVGVSRIGHFGFFRPTLAQSVWPTVLLPELTVGPATPGRPA